MWTLKRYNSVPVKDTCKTFAPNRGFWGRSLWRCHLNLPLLTLVVTATSRFLCRHCISTKTLTLTNNERQVSRNMHQNLMNTTRKRWSHTSYVAKITAQTKLFSVEPLLPERISAVRLILNLSPSSAISSLPQCQMFCQSTHASVFIFIYSYLYICQKSPMR